MVPLYDNNQYPENMMVLLAAQLTSYLSTNFVSLIHLLWKPHFIWPAGSQVAPGKPPQTPEMDITVFLYVSLTAILPLSSHHSVDGGIPEPRKDFCHLATLQCTIAASMLCKQSLSEKNVALMTLSSTKRSWKITGVAQSNFLSLSDRPASFSIPASFNSLI